MTVTAIQRRDLLISAPCVPVGFIVITQANIAVIKPKNARIKQLLHASPLPTCIPYLALNPLMLVSVFSVYLSRSIAVVMVTGYGSESMDLLWSHVATISRCLQAFYYCTLQCRQ